MRNKITDVTDHLIAQIERLGEDGLKGEDLKNEINRSKAMASLAVPIVNAAKITVDAAKVIASGRAKKSDMILVYKNEQ